MKNIALSVSICASIFLTVVPAHGLTGTITAVMYWNTSGDVNNGSLVYTFQGTHRTVVETFSVSEAFLPANLTGTIRKDGGAFETCNDSGLVENVSFNCSTEVIASCLAIFTSGNWEAVSRFSSFSGLKEGVRHFYTITPTLPRTIAASRGLQPSRFR